MNYTRSTKKLFSIDGPDSRFAKARLFTLVTQTEEVGENPWVRVSDEDTENMVLCNNAALFAPNVSWGAVLPKTTNLDVTAIIASGKLELHPTAYDQYVAAGVIDAEGNWIPPLPTQTQEEIIKSKS